MANASVGGYVFDIDPSTATWTYSLKTKVTPTYGGRVVQVLRCNIENLSIGGYLTQSHGQLGSTIRTVEGRTVQAGTNVGGYEYRFAQMKRFERDVRSIMEAQAESKEPMTFTYPILGWSGKVFLTGYDAVKYDVATTAVSYRLSFEVDSGFDEIVTTASSQGLDNIEDGVNWTRNEYNTPTTDWDTVKQALKSALEAAGTSATTESIYTYIEKIEAASTTSTTTTDKKTSGADDLKKDINTNSNTNTFLGSVYGNTTSSTSAAKNLRSSLGGL